MQISLGGKKIDTMNIIFDTINDLVYAMASSGSFFEMKAIALNTAMTKKKMVEY